MSFQISKIPVPTASITLHFPKPIKPTVNMIYLQTKKIQITSTIKNPHFFINKKKSEVHSSKLNSHDLLKQSGIKAPSKRTSIDKY